MYIVILFFNVYRISRITGIYIFFFLRNIYKFHRNFIKNVFTIILFVRYFNDFNFMIGVISKNPTNTVYSYDEKFYEKKDADRTIRIEFFQLYRLNHLQKKKRL